MFGIINPPNAFGSSGSVMNMASSLSSMNPSTQAAATYTANVTSNCTTAANWGMSMNISALPPWAQPYAAENVMYTQAMIALNLEVIQGSTINFGALASAPMMYPKDVASLVRAGDPGYGGSDPSSSSSSSTAASSPTSTGGASPQTNNKSGAGALSSPRVAVALVAVVAVWFAL
jgi:hypothetical protein